MKRIVIFLCLCALAFPLRAQVATVEVSRPYDINTDGIRKPTLPTAVDDSLHRFDVHFDYSIFNRPYGDLYDFTPYETIQLSTVGANRTPFVYARLGSQYAFGDKGLMPAGEIYLQSKPKNGFCSGLYGRHNSFFGDLGRGFDAFPILGTSRMENTVGGDLTYDWATGELMVDVQYSFDRYNYTAKDPGWPTVAPWPENYFPTADHRNNILTAAFNLNSAQKEENTVYYDVTLSYRNTQGPVFVQSGRGLRHRAGFGAFPQRERLCRCIVRCPPDLYRHEHRIRRLRGRTRFQHRRRGILADLPVPPQAA